MYDFVSYLNALQKTQSEIVEMYLKAIDDQMVLMYMKGLQLDCIDKEKNADKVPTTGWVTGGG